MTQTFLKIWNLYLEGIDNTYFEQSKRQYMTLKNVEVDFNRKSDSSSIH